MWLAKKMNSNVAVPSQNISPESFETNPRKIYNQQSHSLLHQIDKLALSIPQYRPISSFIVMETLLASPNTQLKKFKESVFLGGVVETKRSGKGVMLYANGRIYEGDWLNNFKHGKGYEKFANGSVYKGDYVQGKPEGCGRYQWENGQLYEGQWLNGLKHGSGIWRGAKGDSYIGEWREGRADGYGVHTWTNGDRYEGQFQNCLKHGEGVQRFANGDTYKGNYENGKPSGYGEYYWATGSFFKGQFKLGLRSGQGLWKKGPGRTDKYEGEWQADKKQGYGVFTWADGAVYKGNFTDDLKEGQGQMTYCDGSVVVGQWAGDQLVSRAQISLQHDEDCELLVPTQGKAFILSDHLTETGRQAQMYLEQLPQPPMYIEPQRPAFLKSTSRNIRPRNFTRQTARSEIRMRGQSQGGRRQQGGMTKKMSVGTVGGRQEVHGQQEKSMSSSFFLYKIHGNGNQNVQRRQSRTSGGSRGHQSHIDEQLKYFARSKIGSYSQLH